MKKHDFTQKTIVAKELLESVRQNYLNNLESNAKASTLFNPDEYEKKILDAVKVNFPYKRMVDVFCDHMESFEELLREVGLYEEMSAQCHFVNTWKESEDFIDNKRAISIRNLWFYSSIVEKVKARHKITINMTYVYLHAILDGIFMDAIDIVSDIRSKKHDVKSSGSVKDKMDYLINEHVLSKKKNDSTWYDDFILFYEIRHAIIHSKGILNQRGFKKLKRTRHENTYNIDYVFELSEPFLATWIDNVEWIIDEVASGLNKEFQNDVR